VSWSCGRPNQDVKPLVVVSVITRSETKKPDSVSHLTLSETFVKWQLSFSVIYLLRVLELSDCKYSYQYFWHWYYPFSGLYESLCIFPGNVLVLVSDGTVCLVNITGCVGIWGLKLIGTLHQPMRSPINVHHCFVARATEIGTDKRLYFANCPSLAISRAGVAVSFTSRCGCVWLCYLVYVSGNGFRYTNHRRRRPFHERTLCWRNHIPRWLPVAIFQVKAAPRA